MRSAPAVQVVLGADAGWRWGVAFCCAVASASLAGWAALGAECPPTVAAGLASLAGLAGAGLSRLYLPAPAGELAWDGSQWHWNGSAGDVQVALDLGPWLLLTFTAAGRRGGRVTHLPLSRAGARTGWHGLRAAVYSRRPEPRTPSAPRM